MASTSKASSRNSSISPTRAIRNLENFPSQIPLIENELTNVGPRAGFALGNRYELGYRDQGHGWTIGVLDGGTVNQTNTYGFIPDAATNGGVPPFIPRDYTDGSDVNAPAPNTSGPVGDARAFGFGSVPVLFETPSTGYLKGFRDYVQNLAPAHGGTVGGPNLYVGSYGIPVFTEGNTITDNILFRRADDLNGNGIWGDVTRPDPQRYRAHRRLRRSVHVQHLLRFGHGAQHHERRWR